MMRINFLISGITLFFITCVDVFADNAKLAAPLFTHIYAADPSARVWSDDEDTLWLYTSHDVPETNIHASMVDYHVFSTKDLVNWIDYGRVLSVDDVPWATSHAWALDAVKRNNHYYLVFCMREKGSGIFRTGIAVSERPEGPFKDMGFIKNVEWGQDPAIFVDDDNKAYLYWGAGGQAFGAELEDDLLLIKPNTKRELTSELNWVFEGPWVHKYNGKYYLSYPGLTNNEWPEEMYYATADKPLGPFKFEGLYTAKFNGHSGTNHGSIVKYKNQWLAFHHASILSGGLSESRNLMADRLFYDKDGKILPIIPSEKSITNGAPRKVTILLEAETAAQQGGRLNDVLAQHEGIGFSGRGYVSEFLHSDAEVKVLAQVAKAGTYNLKLDYKTAKLANLRIAVNAYELNGGTANSRSIVAAPTSTFRTLDLGSVHLTPGDNFIGVKSSEIKFRLDNVTLTQVTD